MHQCRGHKDSLTSSCFICSFQLKNADKANCLLANFWSNSLGFEVAMKDSCVLQIFVDVTWRFIWILQSEDHWGHASQKETSESYLHTKAFTPHWSEKLVVSLLFHCKMSTLILYCLPQPEFVKSTHRVRELSSCSLEYVNSPAWTFEIFSHLLMARGHNPE